MCETDAVVEYGKLEFVANYYFYESKNFSANHTSFNLSTKFKSILFVHR